MHIFHIWNFFSDYDIFEKVPFQTSFTFSIIVCFLKVSKTLNFYSFSLESSVSQKYQIGRNPSIDLLCELSLVYGIVIFVI